MPASDAARIANWDPYDQNAHADWFDTAYMFGVTDGFDVVIGNPPYIQLQRDRGRLGHRYKDAGYTTFTRRGDIYQLFYEKGCHMLRRNVGVLVYITSNSWLRALYGKQLRVYLSQWHTPIRLLATGRHVFDAVVDTSILVLREGGGEAREFQAVDMDKLAIRDFPPNQSMWDQVHPDTDAPWSILSSTERQVMAKISSKGVPLHKWDIRINRGILTGYNRAFIIGDSTRNRLVSKDPRSAEIIRPILRGRDIRRYRVQWAGLHLITTHNGYGDVPAIDIDDFPAIKSYLHGFYGSLARRQDRGDTPYNLRNCSYYQEFRGEKILWMDMSPKGRFSYSDLEVYCNNKGFMMTGESAITLKYLLAILNSSLITWLMRHTARTTGMGLIQWESFTVGQLPVPRVSDVEQRPFAQLVDEILVTRSTDPSADTERLEARIDRLVYQLYSLTIEEITAVETSHN